MSSEYARLKSVVMTAATPTNELFGVSGDTVKCMMSFLTDETAVYLEKLKEKYSWVPENNAKQSLIDAPIFLLMRLLQYFYSVIIVHWVLTFQPESCLVFNIFKMESVTQNQIQNKISRSPIALFYFL